MLIDFNSQNEVLMPHLNGGEGDVYAKINMQKHGKVMIYRIPAGASIGRHDHPVSDDVSYVISGRGIVECVHGQEDLVPGVCHYCAAGSWHKIINTGDSDLVLFSVSPERH